MIFPGGVSTLAEVGRAMISVTRNGYKQSVMQVKDIIEAAKTA